MNRHSSNQSILVVVGSSGNVGLKARKALSDLQQDFIVFSLASLSVLPQKDWTNLWKSLASEEKEINLLWISACTSNNFSRQELFRLNFDLPTAAIEELASRNQLAQVTTLGTVLEERIMEDNNYVASKQRLCKWLSDNLKEQQFRHIRTHTLVPDQPPGNHMFLGQLLHAVRHKEQFHVRSNGMQVREYLDLSQFTNFLVDTVLGKHQLLSPIQTVGGVRLLKLRRVVELVMSNFAQDLKVTFEKGAISGEVYSNRPVRNSLILPFEDPEELLTRKFRSWLTDF